MGRAMRRIRAAVARVPRPLAAVLVCAIPLTCSEATKPQTAAGSSRLPIALRDTVSGVYADSTSSVHFVLRPASGGRVALFLTAAAQLRVEVRDSAGPFLGETGVTEGLTGLPLLAVHGAPLDLATGHVYDLDVRPSIRDAAGAFRFALVPVDSAPEHRAGTITADDTVDEERLEHAADLDAFTVHADATDEFILFFEVLDSVAPNSVEMVVTGGAGAQLAAMRNAGSGLEARSTSRFAAGSSGDIRLTVRDLTAPGEAARAGPTRYRFQLRRALRAPEHVGAVIVPGDTLVGEAIDYPGDVDEFTVSAPDRMVNVFLQVPGDRGRVLVATVAGHAVSAESGPSGILTYATGRATQRGSGAFLIQVRGQRDTLAADTGPYRLFVYAVGAGPETHGASLQPGDSVEDERIALPGDLDVFTFTVGDSLLGNVVVRPRRSGAAGLQVTMRREAPDTATIGAAVLPTSDSLVGGGLGRFFVPPGTYSLAVEGTSTLGGGYQGGYHLALFGFGLGPEVAADSLTVGDTLVAETANPPGDVDTYRVFARQGQFASVGFETLASDAREGVQIELGAPSLPWPLQSLVTLPSQSVTSPRFEIPFTGWYGLRIWTNGYDGASPGSYRLALPAYPVHPESVDSALAVGDSVVGERLDSLGDVDEFILTAAPGSLVQTIADVPDLATVRVMPLDSGLELAAAGHSWEPIAVGRVTVPPSGRLRIQVYERDPSPSGGYAATGAYRLWTKLLSAGPEHVAPAVAVGDTVAGESLDEAGDVDTFSFPVTAGDTLTAAVQCVWPGFNMESSSDPVDLYVLDPVTGEVVAQALGAHSAGALWDLRTAPFVAAATGTLLVRVQGRLGRYAYGPYRLLIHEAH